MSGNRFLCLFALVAKPAQMMLAVLGFITTVAAIILSVIPAEDEINKPLAVAKVVGLALVLALIGVALYLIGSRRQAQEKTSLMYE